MVDVGNDAYIADSGFEHILLYLGGHPPSFFLGRITGWS
jgi:hypothetical protein